MYLISQTLEVFQFDISGNDINDLQPWNILPILLTLEKIDISGCDMHFNVLELILEIDEEK